MRLGLGVFSLVVYPTLCPGKLQAGALCSRVPCVVVCDVCNAHARLLNGICQRGSVSLVEQYNRTFFKDALRRVRFVVWAKGGTGGQPSARLHFSFYFF